MIEDAALPLALLLHYDRGRFAGPRMVAHPVRIIDDHPRGMIDDPLDDLTIAAWREYQ